MLQALYLQYANEVAMQYVLEIYGKDWMKTQDVDLIRVIGLLLKGEANSLRGASKNSNFFCESEEVPPGEPEFTWGK